MEAPNFSWGSGFFRTRENSSSHPIPGFVTILGLLVEALSLVWNHPVSFVAFVALGGLLLAAGILIYLWALVSTGA